MTLKYLWQAVRPRIACLHTNHSLGTGRAFREPRLSLVAVLICLLAATQAAAHDASAYGGVFRSRSMGKSWLNADTGLFLNAALVVAVDPANSNHLLMGSDTGLMNSVNGGRSWTTMAPELISGAVFAAAFSPDGAITLCATPGGIYRNIDGNWSQSIVPTGATPVRNIVFGAAPKQVYLLGQGRLFTSNDGGARFTRSQHDADDARLNSLAIIRQPSETLFAIAQGQLTISADGGQTWQRRSVSDNADPVETVVPDPAVANRIWAAVASRLHVSRDGGFHWQAIGSPLPEGRTSVRGIAADPAATTLVVTTHRGTYRSTDAGAQWNLPGRHAADPPRSRPIGARPQ